MLREEYQNMGLGLKEIPSELLYVVDVVAGRCQNLADKEIAKLKAEYEDKMEKFIDQSKADYQYLVKECAIKIAQLESEVKRLLSPGLITKNPYTAELSKNAYAHGYKDGHRYATLPEEPSPQLIQSNPYNKTDCCHEEWNQGFAAGIKAETVCDESEEPQPYKELTTEQIHQTWNSHAKINHDWTECVRAVIAADRAKQREVKPLPVSIVGRWYKHANGDVEFILPKQYAIYDISFIGGWLTDEETREFPNA